MVISIMENKTIYVKIVAATWSVMLHVINPEKKNISEHEKAFSAVSGVFHLTHNLDSLLSIMGNKSKIIFI
jgi:hypothetical protein